MSRPWIYTCLILVAAVAAPAQERPRIGLVLGGGGARGLAHVGVIAWLEEHHVPIDSVAGTSMGGLVGGAFAAGMDAAELRALVEGLDWDEVLASKPPYAQLAFRRKEDQDAFPSSFELGLKEGIRLPSALNPAQGVGLVLDRISFPYLPLDSFDELPTPFRAVAVDLVSGREHVFGEGDLSTALRATMAIPGFFAPVRLGDEVLIDGGVLNNIPVNVARDLGADIVVAVDISPAVPSPDAYESLLGVASRTLDVMMAAASRRQLADADHVLVPRLDGVGTLDFSNVKTVIQAGYDAAEELRDCLLLYSVDEDEWQSWERERSRKQRPRELTPEFVSVSSVRATDQSQVQRKLSRHLGEPLDEESLQEELTGLTGLGPYANADYARAASQDEQGLAVNLRQKPYGPPFLKPIIKINAGQTGQISFDLAARLTFFDVGGRRNEWRTDFSVGRTNLVATELYQYLGSGGWFVAPRAELSQETQFVVSDGNRQADYRVSSQTLGGDIGYNFGRSSELRGGYDWGHQRARISVGDPALPEVDGRLSRLSARWRLDRLNSALVPTRGFYAEIGAARYLDAAGAADLFTQARAELVFAVPFSQRTSLLVRGAGGESFDAQPGPIQLFTLGGPFRLGALQLTERRGSRFAYGSAGLLRLVNAQTTGLFKRTYLAGMYEIGDAYNSSPDWVQNGTGGVVSETSFGLLFVGGSFGEGKAKFYFSLGRLF